MSSATKTGGDTRRGSLVIAGSGIASVRHITLETISHLEAAEQIFYLVVDPVTEAYIVKGKDPNSVHNLTMYYAKDKPRKQSYRQMAMCMVRAVRAGSKVLGIFYGHPGVFAAPARMALAWARQEGFTAKMLPGVSSVDYMNAELEYDPAFCGLMVCEATELLLRDRPLNPLVQNVILQVGVVGVPTLETEKSKFQLLVDRLEKDFGPQHEVVHFIGAVLPQSNTTTVTYKVEDLRNEQLAQQISTISTFYIRPLRVADANETMAARLEIPKTAFGVLNTFPQWIGSKFVRAAERGSTERELEQHIIPEGYKSLHASLPMREFMVKLALDLELQERYKENPSAVAGNVQGLTDRERFALGTGGELPIHLVMSRTSAEEPTEDELEEARDQAYCPANGCTIANA